MAEIKTNIVVSVEKAVHDAFREMAQTVWDKHGICVKSVAFSWLCISGVGKHDMVLNDVDLETRTKQAGKTATKIV